MRYQFDGLMYSIRVPGAVIRAATIDLLWPTYMAAVQHYRVELLMAERANEPLSIVAAD